MQLIDTHSHLYLPDFKDDLQTVIERCKQNRVEQIFLPAIDSETHELLLALPKQNPQLFYPMMGLHPCSVKENYKQELETALRYLDNGTTYYAVGEIGLDFYWDVSFKEQQVEVFKIQLGWAIERALPIVIHSRNSTADCIEVLRKYKGKIKGIFHCFSGTKQEAEEIIALNFLLGIGGVVTYKNAGLAEVIRDIDLVHLVLETDSPYLTPVPFRGKRNESSYIKIIAEKVAEVKGTMLEEVAKQTTLNALRVFGIKE